MHGVRLKARLCKEPQHAKVQEQEEPAGDSIAVVGGPEEGATRGTGNGLSMDASMHPPLQGMAEEVQQHQREHYKASSFQLNSEVAKRAFRREGTTKLGGSISYDLWELCWRTFHQVLGGLGAAQPWLQLPLCLHCHRRANRNLPEDTVRNFVAECPVARQLWQAVARCLCWPMLDCQGWETVVSGLWLEELWQVGAAEQEVQQQQPAGVEASEGAGEGVDAAEHGPLLGRWVLWALVHLTNLFVLRALVLQRAQRKSGRVQMFRQDHGQTTSRGDCVTVRSGSGGRVARVTQSTGGPSEAGWTRPSPEGTRQ